MQKLRFLGAAEIQSRLGVGRARAYTVITRKGFPEPYQTLKMGSIWLEDEVEAWIKVHRPQIAEDPEVDTSR